MKKEQKNICIFCEKDLKDEKFREDYILIPWRYDPDDRQSNNVIAKCVHPVCLKDFVELNTSTNNQK